MQPQTAVRHCAVAPEPTRLTPRLQAGMSTIPSGCARHGANRNFKRFSGVPQGYPMELAKPADAPPRRSFSAARYNVESCPHSRRSGQRKGLAQLGGYNLFVLTSWKADPGPYLISEALAARCGSDQHHRRCR